MSTKTASKQGSGKVSAGWALCGVSHDPLNLPPGRMSSTLQSLKKENSGLSSSKCPLDSPVFFRLIIFQCC